MAKKKIDKTQDSEITFSDIIKGNFLNKEEIKKHYLYILLIFGLIIVMIRTNDVGNQKVKEINQLKVQVEEYKSRNAYIQSKLINVKLESELSKQVLRDSLMALENHPSKILVKIDSIGNGKTK